MLVGEVPENLISCACDFNIENKAATDRKANDSLFVDFVEVVVSHHVFVFPLHAAQILYLRFLSLSLSLHTNVSTYVLCCAY